MQRVPTYLHLLPDGELPRWLANGPFRCVVIVQADVSPDWRSKLSAWMVDAGCLYMMAWGSECSRWDDAVDDANLARFDYGEIPEDKFVMTTWHEDASLVEVFWFAKELANHPSVALNDTLLLHVATNASAAEMLAAFENAKD
ncbi:MAG: hypothetical protein DI603_21840 [Roseateles depolymerans]|uniref:DUF7684 domain-containing protein n=1 Tax=Roseateles depolymerans TaxID=76731 RepID=A0A2W5DA35_9BURK|nr:MAG: hypothetical protein DI603_21840 [Roseateles depolymerans]